MLDHSMSRAVAAVARAVLEVGPLAESMEPPLPVAGPSRAEPVLRRIAGRVGAPWFSVVPPAAVAELDPIARVVSDRLDLRTYGEVLATVPVDDLTVVDREVDDTVAVDFMSFCRTVLVCGDGGIRLRAYTAGDPSAPAVVIAPACGMPARLAENWVRALATDRYVVLWESRGLFLDFDDFDAPTGVEAQAGDLFAVMDQLGVGSAHVAGLCGGAVVALAAARRHPERVTSLSLWHGDFDLGPDTPKTDHQRNLQALMAMATRTRVNASAIHMTLSNAMVDGVRPELAHLVLYPYVTAERLFRYCQLNGAIMGTDVSAWLPGTRQPTLVVTSTDDSTAHPDASRLVASALPDARLEVLPHGDHISLFEWPPEGLFARLRELSGPRGRGWA
jgi:pimeloyl-ACP methyl ester carboxylesterase